MNKNFAAHILKQAFLNTDNHLETANDYNADDIVAALKMAVDMFETYDSLNSDKLDEAAKRYLYNSILYDDVYVGNPTDKDCIEMFKAGAQWQINRIMEHAVDGYVDQLEFPGSTWIELSNVPTYIKDGDDVKLIIIKKDDKR